MLNASKAQQLIKEKGLRQNWVIQQVGLKPTAGHLLFRNGLLPKDENLRNSVLEKLANLLGVEVTQLLLRITAKRAC